MEKTYILNMLERLPDVAPDFMDFKVNGWAEGYNDCCIDMFDKLVKIGISAALFTDYFLGEDVPGIMHVRCPKCRTYCGPGDISKYVCKMLVGGKVIDNSPDVIMAKIGEDVRKLIRVTKAIA